MGRFSPTRFLPSSSSNSPTPTPRSLFQLPKASQTPENRSIISPSVSNVGSNASTADLERSPRSPPLSPTGKNKNNRGSIFSRSKRDKGTPPPVDKDQIEDADKEKDKDIVKEDKILQPLLPGIPIPPVKPIRFTSLLHKQEYLDSVKVFHELDSKMSKHSNGAVGDFIEVKFKRQYIQGVKGNGVLVSLENDDGDDANDDEHENSDMNNLNPLDLHIKNLALEETKRKNFHHDINGDVLEMWIQARVDYIATVLLSDYLHLKNKEDTRRNGGRNRFASDESHESQDESGSTVQKRISSSSLFSGIGSKKFQRKLSKIEKSKRKKSKIVGISAQRSNSQISPTSSANATPRNNKGSSDNGSMSEQSDRFSDGEDNENDNDSASASSFSRGNSASFSRGSFSQSGVSARNTAQNSQAQSQVKQRRYGKKYGKPSASSNQKKTAFVKNEEELKTPPTLPYLTTTTIQKTEDDKHETDYMLPNPLLYILSNLKGLWPTLNIVARVLKVNSVLNLELAFKSKVGELVHRLYIDRAIDNDSDDDDEEDGWWFNIGGGGGGGGGGSSGWNFTDDVEYNIIWNKVLLSNNPTNIISNTNTDNVETPNTENQNQKLGLFKMNQLKKPTSDNLISLIVRKSGRAITNPSNIAGGFRDERLPDKIDNGVAGVQVSGGGKMFVNAENVYGIGWVDEFEIAPISSHGVNEDGDKVSGSGGWIVRTQQPTLSPSKKTKVIQSPESDEPESTLKDIKTSLPASKLDYKNYPTLNKLPPSSQVIQSLTTLNLKMQGKTSKSVGVHVGCEIIEVLVLAGCCVNGGRKNGRLEEHVDKDDSTIIMGYRPYLIPPKFKPIKRPSTPLHIAINNRDLPMLQKLLSLNADTSLVDSRGYSAGQSCLIDGWRVGFRCILGSFSSRESESNVDGESNDCYGFHFERIPGTGDTYLHYFTRLGLVSDIKLMLTSTTAVHGELGGERLLGMRLPIDQNQNRERDDLGGEDLYTLAKRIWFNSEVNVTKVIKRRRSSKILAPESNVPEYKRINHSKGDPGLKIKQWLLSVNADTAKGGLKWVLAEQRKAIEDEELARVRIFEGEVYRERVEREKVEREMLERLENSQKRGKVGRFFGAFIERAFSRKG